MALRSLIFDGYGLRSQLAKAPTVKIERPECGISHIRAIDLATTYSRGTYRPTTIGYMGLNDRVRDGNGWDPQYMVTRKLDG
jgi:hypothetical protein